MQLNRQNGVDPDHLSVLAAALGPWGLAVLIVGGILAWRLPAIIKAMSESWAIVAKAKQSLRHGQIKFENARAKGVAAKSARLPSAPDKPQRATRNRPR